VKILTLGKNNKSVMNLVRECVGNARANRVLNYLLEVYPRDRVVAGSLAYKLCEFYQYCAARDDVGREYVI
jgi:hypothetical protein